MYTWRSKPAVDAAPAADGRHGPDFAEAVVIEDRVSEAPVSSAASVNDLDKELTRLCDASGRKPEWQPLLNDLDGRLPSRRNRDANDNELRVHRRHGQNERVMVLARKNALVAGHDEAGRTWARIASVIETCKLNGVDPCAYLRDTLTAIANGHPMSRIDERMPPAYTPQSS